MGIVKYANLKKKAIGSRVNCVLCKNVAKGLSKILKMLAYIHECSKQFQKYKSSITVSKRNFFISVLCQVAWNNNRGEKTGFMLSSIIRVLPIINICSAFKANVALNMFIIAVKIRRCFFTYFCFLFFLFLLFTALTLFFFSNCFFILFYVYPFNFVRILQ